MRLRQADHGRSQFKGTPAADGSCVSGMGPILSLNMSKQNNPTLSRNVPLQKRAEINYPSFFTPSCWTWTCSSCGTSVPAPDAPDAPGFNAVSAVRAVSATRQPKLCATTLTVQRSFPRSSSKVAKYSAASVASVPVNRQQRGKPPVDGKKLGNQPVMDGGFDMV